MKDNYLKRLELEYKTNFKKLIIDNYLTIPNNEIDHTFMVFEKDVIVEKMTDVTPELAACEALFDNVLFEIQMLEEQDVKHNNILISYDTPTFAVFFYEDGEDEHVSFVITQTVDVKEL